MANAQILARIVVIDVLWSLKLAAILKTCVSVSTSLQPFEKATFNGIGVVLLTF
jgi:hypothetical protein